MAEQAKKPGFLARLFGREAPPAPAADEASPAVAPVLDSPAADGTAPPAEASQPAPETETAAPETVKPTVEAAPVAAPVETPAVAPPSPPAPRKSWWARLTEGLSRTSSALTTGITELFTKRKLDAATLDDLEDILIQADLGVDTAQRVAKAVGAARYDKGITPDAVRAILANEVETMLAPVATPLVIDEAKKPFVILMVGVNGSGKTTTIGKLAAKFIAEDRSVMLAAGDTFRAAAIEQLKVWGERVGAVVLAREQGSDAAGLAFDALSMAKRSGVDVLLVDTAGRLQNRTELMAELAKVVRVLKKVDATAPHAVLLVLDATVGQNAVAQVEAFRDTAGVTGLVMTKLDGTARGGILVSLAAKFALPVHFIGVGEGVDDLEPFEARDFARAVAGMERGE
jgi:fused signal recognition particle receptor